MGMGRELFKLMTSKVVVGQVIVFKRKIEINILIGKSSNGAFQGQ